MVAKLMKYEFRSSLRLVSIIWGAVIVMAIILGTMINLSRNLSPSNMLHLIMSFVRGISGVLYGGLIAAVIVATVIIIVQRFNKGLLGEEGYLSHTLPVTTRSLIVSKGLVATIILIVSTIAILLSVFLLNLIMSPGDTLYYMENLFRQLADQPQYILFGVEMLILFILSLVVDVYKIYAALAIGQQRDEHRFLFAVLAYFAINIILGILFVIVVTLLDKYGIDTDLSIYISNLGEIGKTNFIFIIGLIVYGLQGLIFHGITESLLTKKLNLL